MVTHTHTHARYPASSTSSTSSCSAFLLDNVGEEDNTNRLSGDATPDKHQTAIAHSIGSAAFPNVAAVLFIYLAVLVAGHFIQIPSLFNLAPLKYSFILLSSICLGVFSSSKCSELEESLGIDTDE